MYLNVYLLSSSILCYVLYLLLKIKIKSKQNHASILLLRIIVMHFFHAKYNSHLFVYKQLVETNGIYRILTAFWCPHKVRLEEGWKREGRSFFFSPHRLRVLNPDMPLLNADRPICLVRRSVKPIHVAAMFWEWSGKCFIEWTLILLQESVDSDVIQRRGVGNCVVTIALF